MALMLDKTNYWQGLKGEDDEHCGVRRSETISAGLPAGRARRCADADRRSGYAAVFGAGAFAVLTRKTILPRRQKNEEGNRQ